MKVNVVKQHLRSRFGRLFGVVHNGLALVGVGALVVLLLPGWRVLSDSPAGENSAPIGKAGFEDIVTTDALGDDPRYHAIAVYLSRKYRVAIDATERLVGKAFHVGHQIGVDPLLILAVMAIESRFNPIAESVMGAKGLMQVIPRHHQDKLVEHGGPDAVLQPMTNIFVGARILKEYMHQAGNLEDGLRLYSGGLSDGSGQYAQKVLAEKERLRQAVQRMERPVTAGTST